ncbi:MAG TPA: response regulator, partial [Acidobacteriota bacterium]|nr:response regulator [Acidobacteriota bacterium]
MDKAGLLIIEDDEFVAGQMKWALTENYEVYLAEDRLSGLEILKKKRPSIVTLDLGLPPSADNTSEGFQTLVDLLHIDPLLKVIVITGQDDRENALSAVGRGAHDFFCKPVA